MPVRRLLLILTALFPFVLSAQDSLTLSKHEFGLEIGINRLQLTEENMFPGMFTGMGGNLNLFYTQAKKKYRGQFSLDMNFSKGKNNIGFDALSTHVRLQYVYGFQLHPLTDSNKTWYLGPAVFFNPNIAYFPQTDDSHIYWLTQNGIGFNIWACYLLKNKKQLTFEYGMPLLMMESVTDYPFTYSNFNPTFLDVIQLAHRNPYFPFAAITHGARFRVFYDILSFKKSKLSLGYDVFAAGNTRNISFAKHSLNLKLSRTK